MGGHCGKLAFSPCGSFYGGLHRTCCAFLTENGADHGSLQDSGLWNRVGAFRRKRFSLFLLCFTPTTPFRLSFKLSARRSMACRRRIVGNLDPERKRSGGLRTKQAGRGSCRGS
ncbi:unnamed protein product [Citrullus colocynthis]|uniref:Uncharacterized protein n=1 Tax=Citrullus colocynthis TaxID=252529 RepID=A0ABP0Z566_9ROSI